MICWYCYWGWPKPVHDIYAAALAQLDGDESPLQFGPSHIVWSDENFEDSNIDFCLEALVRDRKFFEFTDEQLAVVKGSLLALRAIPLAIRCPPGSDSDDVENSPPPPDLVMVKK